MFQFPSQPSVCETCRSIRSSYLLVFRVRCFWWRTYVSDMSVGEVTSTLVSRDTYITRTTHDLDRSLNETVVDKIRAYRTDYNNRPSNDISFMSPIASTSGSLHSEFVSLLFLQSHRETGLFFESSGVQLPESTGVQFHYHRPSFSSHLKSKIVNILTNSIFRCSSPPTHMRCFLFDSPFIVQ